MDYLFCIPWAKNIMTRSLRTSFILVLFLMAPLSAESRMGGGGMGGGGMGGMGGLGAADGGMPSMPPLVGADGHRYNYFESTRLVPVFPNGLSCTPAASYFGSPADNGGIVLKIPEQTPLLAMAAGDVIAKGKGGNADGNFLWLRFAPEDTGQPFWTFAKYQHLLAVPAIAIGTHVKVGEVVALSGISGRAGQGHDDDLATIYGPSPEFKLGGRYQSMVNGQGAKLDDPMILYVNSIAKPEDAHGLPVERRQIAVAVVAPDGTAYPSGSKTVWPVPCHH